MRILITGFLVLAAWMTLATYLYVCKIKGLCREPAATEMTVPAGDEAVSDTLDEPAAENLVVRPAEKILYFGFDKSDVRPDPQLEAYAQEVKAYLDQDEKARLRFTGHTCSIGSDEYNQALGMRRAQSAKQYFAQQGVPVSDCIVESMGEKEPAGDNRTAAGREKNRRTVITITE